MRNLQKAAVVAAVLGSVGLLGTGTASAQPTERAGSNGGGRCHDLNVDILGQVGLLNGLLGNALNGEGSPGGQATDMGCRIW
ncbi:hypothetical protein ACIQU6_37745 [Streptomyces sp. NPDC090442]|uniref:hypothetical protein n=1 Tax=Streptomyces sp. NPDC090442 TaxID=3365962 RepID=UPI0037F94A47